MANYPQELAKDAVCQSHTGHMTGLWFLPTRPLRLNTNERMNSCEQNGNVNGEDFAILISFIGDTWLWFAPSGHTASVSAVFCLHTYFQY